MARNTRGISMSPRAKSLPFPNCFASLQYRRTRNTPYTTSATNAITIPYTVSIPRYLEVRNMAIHTAAGLQNEPISQNRSVDISISPSIGIMAQYFLFPIFPRIL